MEMVSYQNQDTDNVAKNYNGQWLEELCSMCLKDTKYPVNKDEFLLLLKQGKSYEEMRYLGVKKYKPNYNVKKIAEIVGRHPDTVDKRIRSL